MPTSETRKCECVPCEDCHGKGGYYVDMRGRFVGFSRMDDLHDYEVCEECGGSGIGRTCYQCAEEMEQLYDAD